MDHDEEDATVSQNYEDEVSDSVAKGVDLLVGERSGDEVECEVEVAQREEGEEELHELVDEFDVQQDFSCNGVIRLPDLSEVKEGIDCSEKGSVQPTTTLGDEFGDGIRHISLSSSFADVFQHPSLIPLGNQFPTQDAIFSEVHVGGEDIGVLTVECLSLEVLTKWTVTCFVVLQCVVSVSTKGTWQDGDVSKDGLQRFIQNVGHLVLEVLTGNKWVEQL